MVVRYLIRCNLLEYLEDTHTNIQTTFTQKNKLTRVHIYRHLHFVHRFPSRELFLRGAVEIHGRYHLAN